MNGNIWTNDGKSSMILFWSTTVDMIDVMYIVSHSEDMKNWSVVGEWTEEQAKKNWPKLEKWIEEKQPFGFFRMTLKETK